ncbi:MAG TPA: hypothetical protein GX707_09635 [Epulopiscium sp.]|nr:hypothetical protein [Candidatus Epulonipiscium sp.]
MFFKKKQTKSNQKKDVFQEIETQQLQKEKIPIITLDHSWHQLIAEIKTPQIGVLEKELNNLVKEQGRLNTDYIEYSRLKKEMLDNILELTPEAFDLQSEEAIKKIDDQQKMILKINEKLEKIEPRLDSVPEEIKQTNSKLVDESVRLCYDYINSYREKSHTLDGEIQVIRMTLMKKTEEKKSYDKKADQLYRYLHQIVGPQFIEKLDSVYGDESE